MVTFRLLTPQIKRTVVAVSAAQGARFSTSQHSIRTLSGWRLKALSLIRLRERALLSQPCTTQEDSRKWDSHGSVSSGCPGRHSHSCRRRGEQNPGCPRDPGLSVRPPCSSGSGYTVLPGSVSQEVHISDNVSHRIKKVRYLQILCFFLSSRQGVSFLFFAVVSCFCPKLSVFVEVVTPQKHIQHWKYTVYSPVCDSFPACLSLYLWHVVHSGLGYILKSKYSLLYLICFCVAKRPISLIQGKNRANINS